MFASTVLLSFTKCSKAIGFHKPIVKIRKWLRNTENFKGTNKDQKIYVGRKVHVDRAQSFVLCSHTLDEYVTVTYQLVSSSGTNHDLLCFVHGHGQKGEQKHIERRVLPSFITIYLKF